MPFAQTLAPLRGRYERGVTTTTTTKPQNHKKMKRIIFSLALIIGLTYISFAQSNTKIGVGYFGETVNNAGFVLELEREHRFSPSASLPIRLNVGYYAHQRNHKGIFTDINVGFRKYFSSGLFLEESIGIGVIQTMVNGEDGVFEVDDDGTVRETSRFNQPDLMPSITLGIGYQMDGGGALPSSIWLRPKVFWQYPQEQYSAYHIAVQVGMSWDL